MQARRIATTAITVVLLFLGTWLAAFASSFELLGYPVRNSAGWLGATPRSSEGCLDDVGKVNYWTCGSTEIFDRWSTSNEIWLWVMGFGERDV